MPLTLTLIGGPTALLEFGGVRLLTDPTFDPPGGVYTTGPVTLRKIAGPALTPAQVGKIDFVLLSHDHHFDNLDHSGRELLPKAAKVLTTVDGAGRLAASNVVGLKPWETIDLLAPSGRTLRVVATPGRHGPADGDRGPVVGFVLYFTDDSQSCVYFSGDTVWYEGVAEVAKRFPVKAAILNLGAAQVPAAGPSHLTMNGAEALETARAFPNATLVPLHFEGWEHFREGRAALEEVFAGAGLPKERVQWPEPGRPVTIGG